MPSECFGNLLIAFAFAEQYAYLACASSIDGHVEVAYSNVLAVAAGALHLKQVAHFLDCLVESGGLGVIVQSGFRTVVTVKNGSWYDADTGVVPDVYLSDPALFYDRDRLTGIIDALP